MSPIRNCLVYIGLPTNPQFLGVRKPENVAEVISRNKGPSGENAEYLFMLESALEGLGKESGDEHIKDLADRVRSLQARQGQGIDGATVAGGAVESEIVKTVSSGRESHEMQEETEK